MLRLDAKLQLKSETIRAPNLCSHFEKRDLDSLGEHIWEGYYRDKESRSKWEKRTSAAMDLAMQIQKAKTFPWPDCSNIILPLVTIASLQFHSGAYTSLINGPQIARCRVPSPDPQGALKQRADRVAQYMSYQVLEEDTAWEEQHDRALINLPIIGCNFFKTYYSPSARHTVSELVMAKDLVVDYYATSIESASRKTHIVPHYRNEIREKVLRGVFRDILEEGWYTSDAVQTPQSPASGSDNRRGTAVPSSDQDTPFVLLEQHCLLDLDGDGYAEPYTATIEESSHSLLQLTCGFNRDADIERTDRGQILSIKRNEYFTKYTFIPSPDGGIYDLGFGVLLGPVNESASSIINQLVDAGTMAISAGGFLGRGAKFRGGAYQFAPLEWKRVDATGDDLRKSIFPLPVREPNAVLFQLLVLLINYANRVSGTTDTMVGENPGQNTPAETTRSMIQQGSRIYHNIYKRVWRCMKGEFGKRYVLNGIYLPERKPFGQGEALREDYLGDPGQVCPAADPNIVSEQERLQQAITVKQSAMTTPGYSIVEVEKNLLRAMKVEAIDILYPGPDKVPPLPNPKVQIEQMKLESVKMKIQADIAKHLSALMEEKKLNQAKIHELEASAVSLLEGIAIEKANAMRESFDSAIDAMKAHDDSLAKQIELMMQHMEQIDGQDPNRTGPSGMASPPRNPGLQSSLAASAGAAPGGVV